MYVPFVLLITFLEIKDFVTLIIVTIKFLLTTIISEAMFKSNYFFATLQGNLKIRTCHIANISFLGQMKGQVKVSSALSSKPC